MVCVLCVMCVGVLCGVWRVCVCVFDCVYDVCIWCVWCLCVCVCVCVCEICSVTLREGDAIDREFSRIGC
jgi:hypothetical protein